MRGQACDVFPTYDPPRPRKLTPFLKSNRRNTREPSMAVHGISCLSQESQNRLTSVPRAERTVYTHVPVIECRQCGQVRKRSLPAFPPCTENDEREPSLALPIVCGSACVNGFRRARARAHAHACDATVCYAAGLANDQTHPGIKFRWRIPRSDAATHTRDERGEREEGGKGRGPAAATRRNSAYVYACTPRLCRAFLCEPRRPFMPPIIIENDITVRASRGKLASSRLGLYIPLARPSLRGIVFAQVSLVEALLPPSP